MLIVIATCLGIVAAGAAAIAATATAVSRR
jgi:hypothetical protein